MVTSGRHENLEEQTHRPHKIERGSQHGCGDSKPTPRSTSLWRVVLLFPGRHRSARWMMIGDDRRTCEPVSEVGGGFILLLYYYAMPSYVDVRRLIKKVWLTVMTAVCGSDGIEQNMETDREVSVTTSMQPSSPTRQASTG